MKPPPFPISSQAVAMLEETFGHAAKRPGLAEMVPALCFCFNRRGRTLEGKTFEWISIGHFFVGYYQPKQVIGWARFNLLGREVAFSTDTLGRLKGKRLVVRTVKAGYPNRSAKKDRVLRAVPLRSR
jgi:hypothetical protein